MCCIYVSATASMLLRNSIYYYYYKTIIIWFIWQTWSYELCVYWESQYLDILIGVNNTLLSEISFYTQHASMFRYTTRNHSLLHAHTHTHTHTYIYIYDVQYNAINVLTNTCANTLLEYYKVVHHEHSLVQHPMNDFIHSSYIPCISCSLLSTILC